MDGSMNGRRRVVITGLGALTPLGNDPETSWRNLVAGESGAGVITHFDHADYPIHFACELKDFDPTQWIERKQARRMDRFAQMIVAAARQAEADSGIDIAKEADRVGASIFNAASASAWRAAARIICAKRSIRRACFRSIHSPGSKSFSSHAK